MSRAGVQFGAVDVIDSENDSYQAEGLPNEQKIDEEKEEEEEEVDNNYTLVEYLPEDLARLLIEK